MSGSRIRGGLVLVAGILAGIQTGVAQDVPRSGTVGALAETSKSELDGTWKLVSVEQEGAEMQRDDEVHWVIKEGQMFYGGEPLAVVVIYADSKPAGLDLAFRDPKNTYEGIYVLDKGELKCCLNVRTTGPKDRPFEFATKDKPNLRMLKFERAAPTAGGPGEARGYVGIALALENEKVVIQDVLDKSPAQKAGLLAGDVIVSLGGQAPGDLQSTVEFIRRKAPGRDLAIRVLRGEKEREIAVRVGVFPFSLLGILG